MPPPKATCHVGGAGTHCGHLERRRARTGGYLSNGGTITARCRDCGHRVCRDYRCSLLIPRPVPYRNTTRTRPVVICLPCARRQARLTHWGAMLQLDLWQAAAAHQQTGQPRFGRLVLSLSRQLEAWRHLQAATHDPTHDARLRAAEAM